MPYTFMPKSQCTQEANGLTPEMQRVQSPWDYNAIDDSTCWDGIIMWSMSIKPAKIAKNT